MKTAPPPKQGGKEEDSTSRGGKSRRSMWTKRRGKRSGAKQFLTLSFHTRNVWRGGKEEKGDGAKRSGARDRDQTQCERGGVGGEASQKKIVGEKFRWSG